MLSFLPSPWLIIAVLLLMAGSYAAGRHDGDTSATATYNKEKIAVIAQDAKDLAATAKTIAKLETKHATYAKQITHEVKVEPVYRSDTCQHTPDGLRILNAALTDGPEPIGDYKLPGEPRGSDGPQLRGDDREAGGSSEDVLHVSGSGHEQQESDEGLSTTEDTP